MTVDFPAPSAPVTTIRDLTLLRLSLSAHDHVLSVNDGQPWQLLDKRLVPLPGDEQPGSGVGVVAHDTNIGDRAGMNR